MPLTITKAKITRKATATIDLGEAGLETINFTFRTATPDERKAIRNLTRRVERGDEAAQDEAEDRSTIMLAALIQSWDIREEEGGPLADISIETLEALGEEVQAALWAGIVRANEDAAEAGKSPKPISGAI